jgi:hypothetical protein
MIESNLEELWWRNRGVYAMLKNQKRLPKNFP